MEKVLSSGAVLNLSLCSFSEGTKLMKSVTRELKNTPIMLGTEQFSFNTIKNIATVLISSNEIEEALWPCMERGSYTNNGVTKKINKDLFEDEKARADYIPILKEVLVFSLFPFLKNLNSLLEGLPALNTAIPK
jgi:hypothetical protein